MCDLVSTRVHLCPAFPSVGPNGLAVQENAAQFEDADEEEEEEEDAKVQQ